MLVGVLKLEKLLLNEVAKRRGYRPILLAMPLIENQKIVMIYFFKSFTKITYLRKETKDDVMLWGEICLKTIMEGLSVRKVVYFSFSGKRLQKLYDVCLFWFVGAKCLIFFLVMAKIK